MKWRPFIIKRAELIIIKEPHLLYQTQLLTLEEAEQSEYSQQEQQYIMEFDYKTKQNHLKQIRTVSTALIST